MICGFDPARKERFKIQTTIGRENQKTQALREARCEKPQNISENLFFKNKCIRFSVFTLMENPRVRRIIIDI